MTKKDLIARLANASDLSQAAAKRWLDSLTGITQDGLLRDRQVNLPGLGRLSVKQRPARVGRNPQSGMKIAIPERQAVVFKPSKRLLDQLNTREHDNEIEERRDGEVGICDSSAGKPVDGMHDL